MIFVGCEAHYIPYKITSETPHSSASTISKTEFIDGVSAGSGFSGFSILAAHDSGTIHDSGRISNKYYVMFAPEVASQGQVNIDAVDFGYTAALLPEEIPIVSDMLDKIIKEWSVAEIATSGTFYSFVTHREIYVPETIISNVQSLVWIPTLQFKYSHTNKNGSTLTVIIGSEGYHFGYTITKLAEVTALREDITKANTALKRMGL